MAISTTDDQIIIQVVEASAPSIPGEEALTETLKNETARMLEKCFDHRRQDALESAARTYIESAVHLHKLLCLEQGVHHSQLVDRDLSDETLDRIEQTRDRINKVLEEHMARQMRRYISFLR